MAYGSPVLLLVAATDLELCGRDGLVCGVGPVDAAAATARWLVLERPSAVLHVGLAGARGLEAGALVVGTEAVYRDLAADWPVVESLPADPDLVATARAALPAAAALRIHTSAAVGAARDTVSQGPVVEGMEGFGVLRAAALAGVPAIEVRAISNELGEPDRGRWELQRGLDALAGALDALLPALHSWPRPRARPLRARRS